MKSGQSPHPARRHISDLGNKPRCAIGTIDLGGWTAQGFAITDQLVENLVLISDSGQHSLLEQPKEHLELHPLKQVEEGVEAGCLGQLRIQRRAECLVMPFGKKLQIPGAGRQPLRRPRIAINSSNHWG